jgi:hypothetical protein
MRKGFLVMILLGVLIAAVPMMAVALGLDVEAKGGAGVGLGTTNNPAIAGAVQLSGGAGIDFDLYFLKAGPVDLGISLGVDYSYLSFTSTWSGYPSSPFIPFSTTQTAITQYNYINIPLMLAGSIPLNSDLRLVLKAGGFIGWFLGGTSNLTYATQNAFFGMVNGSTTLNSSTTYIWEGGLNFIGGLDISVANNFAITPQILFNMGLTNTTLPVPYPGTPGFNNTFWALTAEVGIKYKVL